MSTYSFHYTNTQECYITPSNTYRLQHSMGPPRPDPQCYYSNCLLAQPQAEVQQAHKCIVCPAPGCHSAGAPSVADTLTNDVVRAFIKMKICCKLLPYQEHPVVDPVRGLQLADPPCISYIQPCRMMAIIRYGDLIVSKSSLVMIPSLSLPKRSLLVQQARYNRTGVGRDIRSPPEQHAA